MLPRPPKFTQIIKLTLNLCIFNPKQDISIGNIKATQLMLRTKDLVVLAGLSQQQEHWRDLVLSLDNIKAFRNNIYWTAVLMTFGAIMVVMVAACGEL